MAAAPVTAEQAKAALEDLWRYVHGPYTRRSLAAVAVFVEQAAAREEAIGRMVAAWEALGRCEDEFGVASEACGEYMEALDSAIASVQATSDAGSAGERTVTGRIVEKTERPPFVVEDDT